jgi:hypothetical protein
MLRQTFGRLGAGRKCPKERPAHFSRSQHVTADALIVQVREPSILAGTRRGQSKDSGALPSGANIETGRFAEDALGG